MDSRIWLPLLMFENTAKKESAVHDDKTFVRVERMGDFRSNPSGDPQNAYIFTGSDNPITLARTYSIDFLCPYHLMSYPFDTQVRSTKSNLN